MNASEQVPVVDLAPYLEGGADGKRAVARAIAAACEDSGFFCITGHGIDEDLIGRTREVAKAFFDLPIEHKRRIERPANRLGNGYYPFADRALAYTLGVETPPDLQEAWVMGPPDAPPDEPYYKTDEADYFFRPNLWPEGVAGFRETVTLYYRTVTALSGRMLGAVALALDLEEDYFADKIDKAAPGMRLIHYPPQDSAARANQLRAGAHTDYGLITILRSDDVAGTLQVKLPRAGWTDIRPPPGAFVCNLGDAMARWTGGRWASTLHRVANPPPGMASSDRISLVFFHQPNHDAVLSGLGGEDATEPVTFGEHIMEKLHKAAGSPPSLSTVARGS